MSAPELYIDGDRVESTISPSAVIALADVVIVWGSPNLWEHPDPTTITVELIDPTGATMGVAYIGKSLELRHPLHGALFVGRIATAPAELRTVTIDDEPREVWVRTIVAKDPTALLNRRAVGPGTGGAWPAQTLAARRPFLESEITDPLVTSVLASADNALPLRPYAADDEVTLVDMLRRLARTTLGSVLAYEPRGRRLVPAFIDVLDLGLQLQWTGTALAIVAWSNTATMSAAEFRVVESVFDVTVEDAVDRVTLEYVNAAGADVELTQNTSRHSTASTGVRVARFETETTDASHNAFILDRIATSIGNLADVFTPPPVRWRGTELPDVLAITSVGDPTFLSRYETIHIIGSKWAHLQGSARQLIIGGRLSWDGEEWQHDIRLGYHPDPQASGYVSIDGLVTHPSAPLSSFDSSINLATLGWVSSGAA